MLKIIERTKIWFAISLSIIILGFGFMVYRTSTTGAPLNFGMDFAGGNDIQINIGKAFSKDDVQKIVNKYVSDGTVTKIDGNKGVEIKSGQMTDAQQTQVFNDVKKKYNLKTKAPTSTERISGSVGKELEKKAMYALIVANIFMLLYIGWRFEFKFGAAALISLLHDVLITLAFYSVFNRPVNSPFIAGMLTIIGYSINDTIVVFDRIRENQRKSRRMTNAELANTSITQTMTRSIYTVLTVVIAVTSVHIFVPSIREFTEPLLVGIISGCYSSIFIASPLWVIFKNRSDKKKALRKVAVSK
ncbi:protein translocase subunit SecF [Clostridium guangxiense]|uniref:protein translocase subunit SecF n=1 Tax=Clostridium guangxiense TaxID=1662055 RepID=UPI001E4406D9|nr:protein translocase subunit SecF [Clostridium guangxiense]MCD2345320.1 protein translocase subunit SecF [Clostridium guangxiense]